jgi:outer membrane protein assembly factor BamD
MYRSTRLLVLFLAALLGACASVTDPTRDWTAEQFYLEAKSELESGNLSQAIKYFEQLESRFPYGRYTEQAQLELIYVHYKDQEPALAIAAADRFIRMHPTHPNVDYAYYLKGLINFHGERNLVLALLGSKDDMSDRDSKGTVESYNAFRELIERFPTSRYAKDASERMRYLLHAQATNETRVAKYYFERGAYVAAINRCKYVLEHYPRTVAVEHALGIQAMAYYRMGMPDLAFDTARVLRTNFPESRYFQEFSKLGEAG